MTERGIVLLGAGGHARVVCDSLRASSVAVLGYVDKHAARWLDAEHYASAEEMQAKRPGCDLAVCFAGIGPDDLRRRMQVYEEFVSLGHRFPSVQHPRSVSSQDAYVAAGVQIMAGAVVNAFAHIDENAILNTGSIIEHDASVGRGTHIAPGAILLGGARVGSTCLVGAGAVVLPGATVGDGTLVPALARVAP